ncbi:MAG: hypothetical protein H6748_00560 [Spirochaetaceae bacterium]|nr:hypothetical protein [Myxococcales bacterium]MCB9722518.1 hypothetical protein [Spirochaetaceae bacterium]HPG24175.1 hypothetical protein [Myxococcota bacterium]
MFALVLAAATGAQADTASEGRSDAGPIASAPSTRSAAGPPAPDGIETDAAPGSPALTRAASRQRVEAMTPVVWLSHYGAVAIEPVE